MRIQVKLGDIELESNEESCQAYSEIKDLEFHSRSKSTKANQTGAKLKIFWKFRGLETYVTKLEKRTYFFFYFWQAFAWILTNFWFFYFSVSKIFDNDWILNYNFHFQALNSNVRFVSVLMVMKPIYALTSANGIRVSVSLVLIVPGPSQEITQ